MDYEDSKKEAQTSGFQMTFTFTLPVDRRGLDKYAYFCNTVLNATTGNRCNRARKKIREGQCLWKF